MVGGRQLAGAGRSSYAKAAKDSSAFGSLVVRVFGPKGLENLAKEPVGFTAKRLQIITQALAW
jgi:hypothetical protein